MMQIEWNVSFRDLQPQVGKLFELSGAKILMLQRSWNPILGSPVFTVKGRYTSRGWTEWTQGFQFGSAVLQFDATGDFDFLDIARSGTLNQMAPHLSHVGVHDHGFNNISTYGNMLRLIREGRLDSNRWEERFCELALKVSGAVQASRWTDLGQDKGYIYSFNGPHSLFADTMRSLRSLAVAHQLGHVLMAERDTKVSLLHRLIRHAEATALYNVYFGEGRDVYDVCGRVAHESIFNIRDGSYRCPSSQQGYSPFSTWTRGLAWILCGYAEQLEFLESIANDDLAIYGGKQLVLKQFERVATAVAEFYIDQSPSDGICYWDTGAPKLVLMGSYLERPADPFNEYEPVDSSAAVISAQGLIRLGQHFVRKGQLSVGQRYLQSGLTIAKHLFAPPYLSEDLSHEGLLLHSVYHRPNGWDYVPEGGKIPMGEASMWGDYHARELGLMLIRAARGLPEYRFHLS